MAENEVPPKAGDQPPPQAADAVPPAAASKIAATDASSKAAPSAAAYDEFGTAKRNLPPAMPVAIAIVLVAIVIAIIAYTNRAKPAAQGSIDGVWFSLPANLPNPMILVEVTLHNVSEKTLYIKDIKADVITDQGDQSDEAAAASDYDRYLMAYPALSGHAAPLRVEMKIAPGATQKGAVMISLPVTQPQFDARKDLTVTIQPYDQGPIVLHEKAAAAK
ncbi:MAG: hypothetical protein WBW69_16990 [Candidatus Korobacteraceae bacterium]